MAATSARVSRISICLLAGLWAGAASGQGTLQELDKLSLQDLGNIVVTSVAKNPEPLNGAAAAVYVITHDDIMRSGATTLPEILRLAPNLGVFRLSPSNYIVTSRGLSGSQNAQNFPNKLLVLIDGRSVYNPLFSGIYWDQQYVLPENIDRIEVISGPAGALWGANAVNGVINIITRNAADTQGGLLEFGLGSHEAAASVQYGGKLGDFAWYRVYAHDFRQRAFEDSNGHDARDGWTAPQAGFRIDWEAGGGNVATLEGNASESREGQPGGPNVLANAANLLGRWRHQSANGSTFSLQAYVDHGHSGASLTSGGGTITTWDIEAQQDFALGEHHHITWGVGDRIYRYKLLPSIRSDASLLWSQPADTQNLANAFVQDQIALGASMQATVGIKAEDDPYSGLSWMPSMRLSWKSARGMLLWASVARSVRTPTVFDTSVLEQSNTPDGSVDFIRGNPDYRKEKLTAYEAGLRNQWGARAALSVSVYYNDYDDLRSIEATPVNFLPLYWGNGMQGHTYGIDAWSAYSIADWWKLSAGLSLEREHFRFKPGATGLLGTAIVGNDPEHRAFLRSSMNLGQHWKFDADLRRVGALPDPHVPGYTELDARLAWAPDDDWELSLRGMNLLHPWHQEYVLGQADRIGRTVFLDARLTF
ncbi:MAG TPA: TonB-dependent receptor [Rhodanobacteraceae bacterium]|nr:TonB-dependent receptor [Rhodanobacteraceae bacterium]